MHTMELPVRLPLFLLLGALFCLHQLVPTVESSDLMLLRHRALQWKCTAGSGLQTTFVDAGSYHKCKYYDSNCNVEEDACSSHGQCSTDGTQCQCDEGYVHEDNNVNECRGKCQDSTTGEYYPSDSIHKCVFYDTNCYASEEACSGHGQCEEDGAQCQCDSGYVQEEGRPIACRGKCQDSSSGLYFPSNSVHECARYDNDCQVQSEPVCSNQGTCGPDGQTCQCNAGYVHDNGDSLTCRGKCQSTQGTYFPSNTVHNCDFYDDDCQGSSEGVCSGHGTCTEGACSCSNGYEVDPVASWKCRGKCEDASGRFPSGSIRGCVSYDDTCTPQNSVCGGHGTCSGDNSCSCDPGYEEFTSVSGVSSCRGRCLHNGQYLPPNTRVGCEFVDESCQVIECGGHGTCSSDGQSCECEKGYVERTEHPGECKGKCNVGETYFPSNSYFKCTYYDGSCNAKEECGGYGTCNYQDVCSCDWNADLASDNPKLCVARCEDSRGSPYGDITISDRHDADGNWEKISAGQGGGWKMVRKYYCGQQGSVYNHDYLFEGSSYSYGLGPCTYGFPGYKTSDIKCSLNFEEIVPGWNQIALVADTPRHAWFITTKEDFLAGIRDSAQGGNRGFLEGYQGHGYGTSYALHMSQASHNLMQINAVAPDRSEAFILWEGLPEGQVLTRQIWNSADHVLRHIYIRKVC